MAKSTNEQIQEIGEYFKGLTVSDGNFYLLVKFPKKWKVLDEEGLNREYGVYTATKQEGTYFMTEMSNGTDCLFDAVNEVVSINKSLEEKQALLQKKAQELTDLFINEPLEKLKTLEFTFNEPLPLPTKKQTAKKPNKVTKKKEEEPVALPKEETPVSLPREEEKEEKPVVNSKKQTKKAKEEPVESDAMSFLKDLVKNE